MNSESPARNIIGNGTVIKGEIESNGDIRIDGKVLGTLKSTGKIVLGQNGVVEGDISCKQADLSGYVKGKLMVDELTSMKSTAYFEGELSTKQLYIEIGAKFIGKCEMGNTEAPKTEIKK
ncbi:MAG: polymer-forming cytoskeletal protein [Bacteroidales bacterium]|nr:polymer-forming cytoskeletal protein [Bacteroidales bacterium]